MAGFLFTIPLVLALVALLLGVLRSIANAWFSHRLRLELLRKLEKHPELVNAPADVQDLYQRLASVPTGATQDYALTGIILGVIGAACIITGRVWRIGQLASGVYWGGMACVFLGAGLAVFGLLVHLLSRSAPPKA